jgi:hypothetical protein
MDGTEEVSLVAVAVVATMVVEAVEGTHQISRTVVVEVALVIPLLRELPRL